MLPWGRWVGAEVGGGMGCRRFEGMEERTKPDWLLSFPLGWIERSGVKTGQLWCEA